MRFQKSRIDVDSLGEVFVSPWTYLRVGGAKGPVPQPLGLRERRQRLLRRILKHFLERCVREQIRLKGTRNVSAIMAQRHKSVPQFRDLFPDGTNDLVKRYC